MSSRLSEDERMKVEGEVDVMIEHMERFHSLAAMADVEPSEETAFAFTLGAISVMSEYEGMHDSGSESFREVAQIVRRRKPEIVSAFRDTSRGFD